MHRTLRGLVTDLNRRSEQTVDALDGAPSSSRTHQRVFDAKGTAAYVRSETSALLGQPLEDPGHAPQAFRDYGALSDALAMTEAIELPFLARWDSQDEKMTAMCDRLLLQTGWSKPRPLVATFSTDYYWTVPPARVICAPQEEEKRLLRLPDLVHEIGHSVLHADAPALLAPFFSELYAYVQAREKSPPSTVSDPTSFYRALFESWSEWVHEFWCDMFGVYLIGAPFGWQHLHLQASGGGADSAYEPLEGSTHPADDARMRGARLLLEQMHLSETSVDLGEAWDGLMTAAGAVPSSLYEEVYPRQLLAKVADGVFVDCQNLQLRPFYDAPDTDDDVVSVANRAWEVLEQDAAGYGDWEAQALAPLVAALP